MNERSHSSKQSAAQEAGGICCVHEAALEVLAVPVGVVDLHSLLYANLELRQLLGIGEQVPSDGYPIGGLVDSGHSDALTERRRVLLERRIPVRNSPVKLKARDGYGLNIIVDTEPITFGRARQALVQLFRSINGIETLSFSAPILRSQEDARASEAHCLHEATFEALPMPAAILETGRVVSANRLSRLFLGDSWAEGELVLAKVLHEDFLDTGEQLFQLALHNLHATRSCRAKLNSAEGVALYATLDGMPVQYADGRYAAVFAFSADEAVAR